MRRFSQFVIRERATNASKYQPVKVTIRPLTSARSPNQVLSVTMRESSLSTRAHTRSVTPPCSTIGMRHHRDKHILRRRCGATMGRAWVASQRGIGDGLRSLRLRVVGCASSRRAQRSQHSCFDTQAACGRYVGASGTVPTGAARRCRASCRFQVRSKSISHLYISTRTRTRSRPRECGATLCPLLPQQRQLLLCVGLGFHLTTRPDRARSSRGCLPAPAPRSGDRRHTLRLHRRPVDDGLRQAGWRGRALWWGQRERRVPPGSRRLCSVLLRHWGDRHRSLPRSHRPSASVCLRLHLLQRTRNRVEIEGGRGGRRLFRSATGAWGQRLCEAVPGRSALSEQRRE